MIADRDRIGLTTQLLNICSNIGEVWNLSIGLVAMKWNRPLSAAAAGGGGGGGDVSMLFEC